LDELYDLLIRLRERLREIRKTASDSRF